MRQITEIAGSPCGPLDSGNAGKVAGPVAASSDRSDGPARIRLVRPSPPATAPDLRQTAAGDAEPGSGASKRARGRMAEWTGHRDEGSRARGLVPAVPLIDREHEVGELRAALAAALGGSGRVVLLGGEPGIG